MAHLESAGERSSNTAANTNNQLNLQGFKVSLIFFRVELWLPVTVILGGLTAWEISASSGLISTLFFPAPSMIFLTLCQMLWSEKFWISLGMTLYRLATGVFIGAGSGLLLGWLMGASRPVRIAFDPIVAALHPMPKLAIFPIFLILLGIGESSKIALIGLAAFFPILINTLAGVQQIDRAYWEVATNYGANRIALLQKVILPGSLPMVLTGLRLALNNALVVTIAIEMLSAQEGLGAQIWMTWQTLRTEELYATLVVIGIVGLLSNALIRRLIRHLMPWHTEFSTN